MLYVQLPWVPVWSKLAETEAEVSKAARVLSGGQAISEPGLNGEVRIFLAARQEAQWVWVWQFEQQRLSQKTPYSLLERLTVSLRTFGVLLVVQLSRRPMSSFSWLLMRHL